MSKKSKSKSKDKRLKDKKARKQIMKAKYEAFRTSGKNTKSKRFALKSKKQKAMKIKNHPNGKCGNFGCRKCFTEIFRPFLKEGKPYLMSHAMWKRWTLEEEKRK